MKGEKVGMNINCREALHSVYHFLDGEMTPERRDQIARHIDKCAPCLRAFGFETEIRRLIADRCRDKVPEELKNRIAAVIAHEHKLGAGTGAVADSAEH
ncbi:MAG: mycothiol system anti-sigma-R factor [Acidimicrobiales bacterium]|jgi:mycothiol system anti-sigma-R factor